MNYNKFKRPDNIIKDNIGFISEIEVLIEYIQSILNDIPENSPNVYTFKNFYPLKFSGLFGEINLNPDLKSILYRYKFKPINTIDKNKLIDKLDIKLKNEKSPFYKYTFGKSNLIIYQSSLSNKSVIFIRDISFYGFHKSLFRIIDNNELDDVKINESLNRFDNHDYGIPGSGNNPYRYVPYEFIKTIIKPSKQKIFNNIRKYNSVNANGNEYIKMSAAQFELVTGTQEYRYSFGNNFKKYI